MGCRGFHSGPARFRTGSVAAGSAVCLELEGDITVNESIAKEIKSAQATATAQDATREMQDAYGSIRADVADLASSVKKLAGAQLGDAVSDVSDVAQERLSQVEQSIRKNPTQAALIAAGVGFLVGLVLTR